MHDFNIKNMYVDKLDEVVNRYNNIYHSTIRMKPVDVKSNKRITLVLIIKMLDLKFVVMLEYQNITIFLQKAPLQIGLKKFF